MTNNKTSHPYITCDEEISGGVPIIRGTRMRVIQIAQEYIKLGYTPEDIINAQRYRDIPAGNAGSTDIRRSSISFNPQVEYTCI